MSTDKLETGARNKELASKSSGKPSRNRPPVDYKSLHEGKSLSPTVVKDAGYDHSASGLKNEGGEGEYERDAAEYENNPWGTSASPHSWGNPHTGTSGNDEDEEIERLKKELSEVSREEALLKKRQEADELRRQIAQKKTAISKLREYRKVIIVWDSIIKDLNHIDGVTLKAFPGATIGKLAVLFSKGHISLEEYDYIIIHVGTNNVGNRNSVDHIKSDYGNLVATVRKLKPHIRIVISSILPRPVDHKITDPVIK